MSTMHHVGMVFLADMRLIIIHRSVCLKLGTKSLSHTVSIALSAMATAKMKSAIVVFFLLALQKWSNKGTYMACAGTGNHLTNELG